MKCVRENAKNVLFNIAKLNAASRYLIEKRRELTKAKSMLNNIAKFQIN